MTFDAGSIEATLDLDRTPFQRGLAAAKREARDFARERITARLDLDADTSKARREIEKMRRGFDRKVKVDVDADTAAAEAHIAALRAEMKGLGGDAKQSAKETEGSFHLLLDSLAILGPAMVPLASGLAGLSSAAISFGGVLTLAVKGASAAMKEGNAVGVRYAGTLATLKDGVTQLEATAARGVLRPFEQETNLLNRQIPQLNSLIGQLSPVVGDALGHGASGLVGLLTEAEPLLKTATGAVDSLFARFDSWANSGGGQGFFSALAHDIPIATEAVGNLFSILGHVIQGAEGPGRAVLGILNDITGVVKLLPSGVWSVIIGGLVTWRGAALASSAANAILARTSVSAAAASTEEAVAATALAGAAGEAAAAVNSLAGANARMAGMRIAGAAGAAGAARGGAAAAGAAGAGSAAAAGAGAGFFARGAGMLARALPWAIGAYLGGSVLKSSTSGMRNSESQGVRALHGGLDVLSDFFTGHWSFGDVGSDFRANAEIQRRQQLQRDVRAMTAQAYRPGGAASMGTLFPYRNPQNIGRNDAYNQSAGGRYALAQSRNDQAAERHIGGMTDPTAIAQSNDAITASLQKRIEAENKLFDSSHKGIELNGGLKVSEAAFNAEMEKTGNNIVATTNFFRGHNEALHADQATLEDLQDRQQRYNGILASVAGKYDINTQAAGTYLAALGLTYDKVTANSKAESEAVTILGEVNKKFADGNESMQGWLATISQVDLSTDTLSQRVTILGAGLKAIQGTTNSMAGANLTAVTSIEDVANSIETNSKSVSKHGNLLGQLVKTTQGYIVQQPKLSAGSLQIQQSMAAAGSSAIALAQSIYQNTGNAVAAFQAYRGLRSQFISTEIQAGKTRGAAKKLADQIYGVPKDAKTFVHLLNKDNVASAIKSLTQALIGPGGLNNTIAKAIAQLDHNQFDTDYDNVLNKLLGLSNTTVTIPYRFGQKPGNPPGLPAFPADPSAGKPPVKADGGLITEGTGPRADDVHILASKGEFVVNAVATEENLPTLIAMNAKRFADGGRVGPKPPPSLITNPSKSGGSSGSKSKGSSKVAQAAKTALNALISELDGDISAVTALLPPVNATRATIHQLDDTFTKFASKGYMTRRAAHEWEHLGNVVIAQSDSIAKIGRQIGRDQNLLQKVSSERTASRGNVLSLFDVGSSGNGYRPGILESLGTANRTASKFSDLQKRAEALGLDPRLIRQMIEEEGPAAAGKNLAAIVGGGKSYVNQLNAGYKKLVGTANVIGDRQTGYDYGTTQARLTAKIRDETTRQTRLQHSMNEHLKALRTELGKLRHDMKNRARTK